MSNCPFTPIDLAHCGLPVELYLMIKMSPSVPPIGEIFITAALGSISMTEANSPVTKTLLFASQCIFLPLSQCAAEPMVFTHLKFPVLSSFTTNASMPPNAVRFAAILLGSKVTEPVK